jgi:hypothetical protein
MTIALVGLLSIPVQVEKMNFSQTMAATCTRSGGPAPFALRWDRDCGQEPGLNECNGDVTPIDSASIIYATEVNG